ncbi:MAG: plasmid pRiA4b ORF-3 family protein [Leifsonia sp.]
MVSRSHSQMPHRLLIDDEVLEKTACLLQTPANAASSHLRFTRDAPPPPPVSWRQHAASAPTLMRDMPKKKHKARTKSTASRSKTPASRTGVTAAESQLLRQFSRWYDAHLIEIADLNELAQRRELAELGEFGADGSLADPADFVILDDINAEHRLADHQETNHITDFLKILVGITRTLGNGQTLAAPTAKTLEDLLDAAETDFELGALRDTLIDSLWHYLEFLDETGEWDASDEDFDASFEFLEQADDAPGGIMPMLIASLDDVPEVSDDDLLSALDGLTIVEGFNALLVWLGEGRPLRSEDDLQVGDIATVAALIGIKAVGREKPSATLEPADAHPSPPSSASVPLAVASLWEIPALAVWWQTLLDLHFIEVTDATVRPGVRVLEWHGSDLELRRDARADLVALYLETWFAREIASENQNALLTILHLLAQLALAVRPEAFPGLGSSVISDVLHGAIGELDTHDVGDERTQAVLEQLQAAGLVESTPADDGTVRYLVPLNLRPLVAESLRMLAIPLMAQLDIEGGEPAEVPANTHPLGTVLQLRIELDNTVPLVWRSVQVDAHATFAALHHVIQNVFSWQGTHPHLFECENWSDGGYGDLTFGQADPLAAQIGITDEASASVGALLAQPGDEFRYVYDFDVDFENDNEWAHTIQLEEVLPETTEATPRCVAGGGLAPLEESGGPDGWAELIELSSSPKLSNWADARERLGLHAGERIDPARFDLDEVNSRLEVLRR